MANESIKGRFQNKHDTEENWLKAINFIPLQGELIIYDIDDNYDYERFKIGDGVTNVNTLPFRDPDTVLSSMVSSASGLGLIELTDVSPIEHNISCNVESKNLIPTPYYFVKIYGNEYTSNGITCTLNSDNSVTVNGTATDGNGVIFLHQNIVFPKGTYTLSGANHGETVKIAVYKSDWSKTLAVVGSESSSSTPFTLAEDTEVLIYITVFNGETANNITVYPQIEKGIVATSYTPWVDIGSINNQNRVGGSVIRYSGKNLVDTLNRQPGTFPTGESSNDKARAFEFDKYYIGLSVNNFYQPANVKASFDGQKWHVKQSHGYSVAFPVRVMPETTYCLSLVGSIGLVSFYEKNGKFITWNRDGFSYQGGSFTTPSNCGIVIVCLQPQDGKEEFETFYNIQLERGSSKTDYEPSEGILIYNPNKEGIIEGGILSVSSTMNLFSDEGTIINVEYYNNNFNEGLGLLASTQAGLNNQIKNTNNILENTNNQIKNTNNILENIVNGNVSVPKAQYANEAGQASQIPSRNIELSGGVNSTAQAFNGTGDISIPVTGISEAYLTWGGKNFSDGFGPIDAAMIPQLGANRLAFFPSQRVTLQYSIDNGVTWTENHSNDDDKKRNLFVPGAMANFTIGDNKDNQNKDTSPYQCRVILTFNNDTSKFGPNLYTILNKIAIYISTDGSYDCYCTIDGRKANSLEWIDIINQVPINGWSGWNIINTPNITTYGGDLNQASTQYGEIRLTFGVGRHSADYLNYRGLTIQNIMAFGGVGWTTPSNMAATGNIYRITSWQQEVAFPANVFTDSYFYAKNGQSNYYTVPTCATPFSGAEANKFVTIDKNGNLIAININSGGSF